MGFAITMCMVGGLFTPVYAYASDSGTAQQNGETASEITAQTESGNDSNNADSVNGSNEANKGASSGNGETGASNGDQSDGTTNGSANGTDESNNSGADSQNGAASAQSTDNTNSTDSSDEAKFRLVPRITTKEQAHAQANSVSRVSIAFPSSWDEDLARIFPDRVLRILVDRQARIEYAGDDMSDSSTETILSWMTGDDNSGKWNLYNAYNSWRQERINAGTFNEKEDRVKLLNGIQYLDGLEEIYASSVDSSSEGVGLQALAFPGIGTDVSIPDLTLRYNNLHIFPNTIFPERQGLSYNLPSTRRGSIFTTQDMYHHVAVTYVRDGKGGKRVEFLGGIYKLCSSAEDLLPLSGAANGVDTCTVPIFDESVDKDKRDFNTVTGMTIGAKTQTGFTATTGGSEAADGQLYRQVGYDYIAINTDGNYNRDAYSFSYGYHLLVNYLSTVKQSSATKVLGDFKFEKTSSGNSGVALKGAEYVLKTTDGKYITGAYRDGAYWASTDDDGALVTTTDKSKALRLVTGEQGTFTVRGIPGSKDGVDYLLEETKAPAGYAPSSGDVHVKVRVAADLTTQVTGGEGSQQTVTADSVKADASDSDDWVNAVKRKFLPRGQTNPNQDRTSVDYANSGDAMILKGTDGSTTSAQSTKNASDYDGGADLFIKNGGNKVTFSAVTSEGAALPAGYHLERQESTLSDGTGKTLLKSSDDNALGKVSDYVNDIIDNSKMTKTTDYYNVNTVAVYHDSTSADTLNNFVVSADGKTDQNVQRDDIKPVQVSFNATKKLLRKGDKQQVKAGEFKFKLEPDAASVAKGAPAFSQATVEVGADGTATWAPLTFSADWWKSLDKSMRTNPDGVSYTYTMSEVNTGNKRYDYDTTTYNIGIRISEKEEYGSGVTKGLTLRVYVNGAEKLCINSAEADPAKVPVVAVRSQADPGTTFTNVEKTTDFEFTKKDGESGDPLAGAEFQLYRYDGDCDETCKATPLDRLNPGKWQRIDVQTSGSDGKVKFAGLVEGTYRLIESKAPDGYLKPKGQWNVVVDMSKTDKEQLVITAVSDGVKPPAFETDKEQGLSVANYHATSIPSTGGRGLMIFTMAGAVLVLAGVAITVKRTREADDLNAMA
ncbi:hypothetical protein KIH75_09150 [Bifidobacterium sp. 64T4]|uniref:SpaA isopeptide-forming pilin-related protein n=1 Tax=Bifidobacterium pongonis TaxID=2834432 RepID=UPI001C565EAE|nr:SpaA isopeptide-forming pilin-related protein [Bifidobacterium pongonis]MBW3095490.1 hypothetical protein [Bifidobacterium pongonis]